MNNPLLQKFDTLFETVPFSKIKNSHFKPAFIEAIKNAKKEIFQITSNPETPSFENTVNALDFSGQKLDRISSIFFNLNAAETSDEIQKIAQEISPLLSEFSNDVSFNEALFEKIKTLYNKKEKLNLTVEQDTLLTQKYKGFVRNGANLTDKEKTKLRKIDAELSKTKLKFGENVLAETHAYQLHITSKKNLKGLPESVIEAAELTAKQSKKSGWIFTLDAPSYIPFVTFSANRKLRKELSIAYGRRAFRNNAHDNKNNILKIVKLRYERAQLLGYQSHAHYVLEERMAENPENVTDFLNDLLDKAYPAVKKEFNQLSRLAEQQRIKKIQKWDSAYFSEKLKKELFNFEEEQLKPYFKLENVLQGIFTITNKLYDLNFEEITSIDTYHHDVKTFKVTNTSGNYIAVLYTDFFPRKGKRNGAWMTSFKGQWKKNNENSRPHISIVCNFTKPTSTKPSLLTFNEVTTLFHEFGHALHGMLANTTYPSLSGTNVYWDFVELPSQVFENWCYQEEALRLFAKHYQTGELIPTEFIEKIKKSSNFLEGLATIRQLSFGFLDMAWHTVKPSTIKNVKSFEVTAFKNTQLFPEVRKNCMSSTFSHIFQGGYAAGYYSYKWAEVLDADAFSLFLEKGIFDEETAKKFKTCILEKGGTDKPMNLYETFRGRKPTTNALLKRAGLLK